MNFRLGTWLAIGTFALACESGTASGTKQAADATDATDGSGDATDGSSDAVDAADAADGEDGKDGADEAEGADVADGADGTGDGAEGADSNEGPPNGAPGVPITDPTAKGTGACAETTLAQVIAAIHTLSPDLVDIDRIKDPALEQMDGNFVYAWGTDSGAFALALVRGTGDCEAGCIDEEWWYFQTGEGCTPSQVGHFADVWVNSEKGSCIQGDGEPLWDHPVAPDPTQLCGADNTPKNIEGVYSFTGTGVNHPCALGGEATEEAITAIGQVTIVQNDDDPSLGTVAVVGIGDALLQTQPWPARFTRSRLAVNVGHNEGDPTLPGYLNYEVTIEIDFEGMVANRFSTVFAKWTDASENDYCKGYYSLSVEMVSSSPGQ